MKRLGVKQAQLSRWVDVDANTANDWATGKSRIPGAVWLIIDLLKARPELKDVINSLR